MRRGMRVQRRIWVLAASLASLFFTVSCSIGADSGFVSRSLEVEGDTYLYQVFVPSDWTSVKKWPVILFLHGAGERGVDGSRQTRVGLPPAVRRQRANFPALVVMPQCRRGTWWGDPKMEAQAFRALDETMREFNGDPDRIYLTGLSLGGFGTWAFGYKYPDRFAALVPVCGGIRTHRRVQPPEWHPSFDPSSDPYAKTAQGIGQTPVWAFHGALDATVPVSESKKLVQALKDAGGNVRYTEYPGLGHNSWDRAYSDEDLIPWLLSQRKSAR